MNPNEIKSFSEEQLEIIAYHKRHDACAEIVKLMCEHDLMNGWFGDTSEDFQEDQVNLMMDMTKKDRKEWLERNRFNLDTYCLLPPQTYTDAL